MKIEFRCWDDCVVTGCPGHSIECKRQNSVMLLHFVHEDGRKTLIPEVEFKAMMDSYVAKYSKETK